MDTQIWSRRGCCAPSPPALHACYRTARCCQRSPQRASSGVDSVRVTQWHPCFGRLPIRHASRPVLASRVMQVEQATTRRLRLRPS
eukprot:3331725-Pyramimonas_sp.AAC.1